MSYAWAKQGEKEVYLLTAHGTVILGHVGWDEARRQYQAVYRGWQVGRSADLEEAQAMVEQAEDKLRGVYTSKKRSRWLVTLRKHNRKTAGKLYIEAEDIIRTDSNALIADGVYLELHENVAAVEKLSD